ncbi:MULTISPECIES: Flp family type IVb pilin [unclassified Sphingomonas]|uniref:Flp family type IVb pilin n=1 Tax=unclassified Sphingomonas TaxID=196159 RepID=UPI0002892543|nr:MULTISPECIES: Flp family type IVb pilin [unclassified Sphingomonas]
MFVGLIKRLLASRKAGTAIEYGLIIALVVLAMIAALGQFASATTGMWNRVSTAVVGAGTN